MAIRSRDQFIVTLVHPQEDETSEILGSEAEVKTVQTTERKADEEIIRIRMFEPRLLVRRFVQRHVDDEDIPRETEHTEVGAK